MLQSSKSQLTRSAPFCTTAKPVVQVRRSAVSGARPATLATIWTTERRHQTRSISTLAQPEDKTTGVAEQTEPIAPFKAAEIGESDWNDVVLNSGVPVLVDFWAPWCGPCRMIGPIIDDIIEELGDSFKAVKLNTDKNPSVAKKYGIRSIPTCMIFKDGKKVDTIIGAVKSSVLKSSIQKFMDVEK